MPRPIGLPKTGGRKKGTPNQSSLQLGEVFQKAGLDVPSKIVELIPSLLPQEQVRALLDLMNYLYPKRKAVEHSGVGGGPIQVDANRFNIRHLLNDPDALAAMELLEMKLDHHETSSN